MIDWIPVVSERVQAIRYDSATDTIFVRFLDGAEWQYSECPPHIWEEFASANTSKGRYIREVLDTHPKGPTG